MTMSELFKHICLTFILMMVSMPALTDEKDKTKVTVMFYHDPVRSYMNEQGYLVGSAVDTARDFLKSKPVPYEMELLPWARLIRKSQSNHHTLIPYLVRTKEREKQFHWLHKVAENTHYLVAKKGFDASKFSLERVRAGEYLTACEEKSAQCEMLRKIGFPKGNVLKLYNRTPGHMANLVLNGRVDFVVESLTAIAPELEMMNIALDNFIEVYKISTLEAYIAAPIAIDSEILKLLMAPATVE